jgi:UDPglucose 6-dehydrogenase
LKISVVGTGYVGLITGTVFAHKGHSVLCVDKDAAKIEGLRAGKIPIYEPGLEPLIRQTTLTGHLRFGTEIAEAVAFGQIIFICVDTPARPDGTANLSSIEAVSRGIAQHLQAYRIVVEKSTVPVLTGEHVKKTIERHRKRKIPFDVVSNPEFLREGSAVADALNPDRIVIGTRQERAAEAMRKLYLPFEAPIIVTDIQSAEIIKHASNSFLALKISFINAVANLCERTGADVTQVAHGMGLDERIGRNFLRAGIGYGGSCFPKDVAAFAKIAERLGCPIPLLEEVQKINDRQRIRFLEKIEKELNGVQGKRIGLLGLSFKPDTDDIRESPAVDLGRRLLRKKARVQAYDPQAMPKAASRLKGCRFVDDPYEVAEEADALVLATEWSAFREMDLGRVKSLMRRPILFDGRNLFDPATMKELGFRYHCVGRP